MAALAKQSIFDLPTLARQLVAAAQEQAESENDPEAFDVLISKHYVLMHDDLSTVTE